MGNDTRLVEKEKENIKVFFLTFKSLHFLSFRHLRKALRQKPILTLSEGAAGKVVGGSGVLTRLFWRRGGGNQ